MGAHLVSAAPPPGDYEPYAPDPSPEARPEARAVPAAAAWWRRPWALAVAGLAVGAGLGGTIGVAAGSTDAEDSPEYRRLSRELASARDELGELPERRSELADAEAELDERLAEVNALEKDVERRERAVHRTESAIERATLRDGIYEIGIDVEAGTYRTEGAPDCYWARTDGPDGQVIAEHEGDGPAAVTVRSGEALELDCSDAGWVRQP